MDAELAADGDVDAGTDPGRHANRDRLRIVDRPENTRQTRRPDRLQQVRPVAWRTATGVIGDIGKDDEPVQPSRLIDGLSDGWKLRQQCIAQAVELESKRARHPRRQFRITIRGHQHARAGFRRIAPWKAVDQTDGQDPIGPLRCRQGPVETRHRLDHRRIQADHPTIENGGGRVDLRCRFCLAEAVELASPGVEINMRIFPHRDDDIGIVDHRLGQVTMRDPT